jgi:hypothetical protein
MVRGRAVSVFVACIGCSTPKIAFDDVDAAALTASCERLVRCGVFADQDSC